MASSPHRSKPKDTSLDRDTSLDDAAADAAERGSRGTNAPRGTVSAVLDNIEMAVDIVEEVEGKVTAVTQCTWLKEKALAVIDPCVVILRPVCRPVGQTFGVRGWS